jgi:hypothetical protein
MTSGGVDLTFLSYELSAVIPAPYPAVGSNRQERGKLRREFRFKRLDSPVSSTGQAYQVQNDKRSKVVSEIA